VKGGDAANQTTAMLRKMITHTNVGGEYIPTYAATPPTLPPTTVPAMRRSPFLSVASAFPCSVITKATTCQPAKLPGRIKFR
jgi:hypothetical protein